VSTPIPDTAPLPGSGTSTGLLERPETQTGGGGGDANHRAHIVKRPADRESADGWVTEARVLGLEVEALCGHRWIPAKDPEKYPVCQTCRDVLSHMT